MNKNKYNAMLKAAVPKASPQFSTAVRSTLAKLSDADTEKEKSMKPKITKRRTATFVLAAVLIVAVVAAAATLFTQNLFDVTMGDTPENAASLTRYNLADETIGNAKITVKEAAYDGMSLYILCAVRDLTADQPLGTEDTFTGDRYLTQEDYDRIDALGVKLWLDGLWIDGQDVPMPSMSITQELPGAENGELYYYYMLRLDQENIVLNGKNVEITLPIGQPQDYESLTYDEQTGKLLPPEAGLISFHMDCSDRDQVTVTQPDILTEGVNWSAKASQVVYSPLRLYVTLDWEIKPEVLEAYIAENGDGYYENGVKYWDYDALEVCGSEFMEMRLVNADGTPVFEAFNGFYSCGSVSNTQAWFTFPYADAYPDTMYLAPTTEEGIDMAQAIQIK